VEWEWALLGRKIKAGSAKFISGAGEGGGQATLAEVGAWAAAWVFPGYGRGLRPAPCGVFRAHQTPRGLLVLDDWLRTEHARRRQLFRPTKAAGGKVQRCS